MGIVIYLVSALVIIVTYVYVNFKKSYRIWPALKIPYEEPSFPFGNFKDIKKCRHFIYIARDLYEKLKGKYDCAGIWAFKWPMLVVVSPEMTKKILVDDFDSFDDRGLFYNPKHDPLSINLYFMEGPPWKRLRTKLSPAFSSDKMKLMFQTVQTIVDDLTSYIEKNGLVGTEVDVKDLTNRYALDVMSSCAFGMDGHIQNPNADMLKFGMRSMKIDKTGLLCNFLGVVMSEQIQQLGIRMFDNDTTKFFTNIVHETIAFRREENYHRNDLMQSLIEHLKLVKDDNQDGLTIDEIVAQCFVFFFAGFETSSTTIQATLYYLAQDPTVQDRLRVEIGRALSKHENKLCFDALEEMDLLDRSISETLRLFPPVGSIHRKSTSYYKLPSGGILPKGTPVIIPIFGFHHDPDIFPDPERFDPERFTAEAKAKRHPYSYLPFGEGPRACIGIRFAMLQTKCVLVKLLSKYRFSTCDNTPAKLEADIGSINAVPKDSLWLKLDKI